MAGQDNNGRKDALRVLRPVLAVLAACVIAFCGWSAYEYAQGANPLAFLGGDAFQTVAEGDGAASSIELSSNEADSGDEVPADDSASEEAPVEDSGQATEGSGEEGAAASSSVSSGSSANSGSGSSGGAGSSGSSSGAGSAGSSSSGGSSSGGASPSPGPSRPARITVYITVDGSSAGAGASSATLALEPGATVYDALASSGVSFNAKATGYGMYVSSIAGLAEKEHGGMSGWMYSVNGVTPNVACSSYELSDGDSVYWWYANVTE